jgi:hypothetical protein
MREEKIVDRNRMSAGNEYRAVLKAPEALGGREMWEEYKPDRRRRVNEETRPPAVLLADIQL